ncbi:hypothetical protein ABPG75_008647 [Micractinium tetrahymenae]
MDNSTQGFASTGYQAIPAVEPNGGMLGSAAAALLPRSVQQQEQHHHRSLSAGEEGLSDALETSFDATTATLGVIASLLDGTLLLMLVGPPEAVTAPPGSVSGSCAAARPPALFPFSCAALQTAFVVLCALAFTCSLLAITALSISYAIHTEFLLCKAVLRSARSTQQLSPLQLGIKRLAVPLVRFNYRLACCLIFAAVALTFALLPVVAPLLYSHAVVTVAVLATAAAYAFFLPCLALFFVFQTIVAKIAG